jgi:hypothetical protein
LEGDAIRATVGCGVAHRIFVAAEAATYEETTTTTVTATAKATAASTVQFNTRCGVRNPAVLLLRLFFADFAEELFAAQSAFFFDDDFAQPGPASF